MKAARHLEHNISLERRRAFASARRHTLIVRSLRKILPLGAICFVGFYVVQGVFAPKATLQQVDVSNIELAQTEIALENPRIQGVTDSGQTYEILSQNAFQNASDPQKIRFETVNATLTNPEDGATHILAQNARFDGTGKKVWLSGQVSVTSPNGEVINAEEMILDLGSGAVVADGQVLMQTANGFMSASAVNVNEDGSQINFTGPVKVIMHYRADEHKSNSSPKLRQSQ